MKKKTLLNVGKHLFSTIAPLGVLLLLAFMPVGHATNIVPDKNVAVADTQVPSDVENVKAVAGDSMATLTWDVATDNVGVSGYKVYYGLKPVKGDGDSYTYGPVDVKNVITYQVKTLKNGTTYYFSVTAYDAAGNESNSYSLEGSATPSAVVALPDAVAPKVAKAVAVDKAHVSVVFSEAVQVPATHPESAFGIKEDATSVALNVTDAVLDSNDALNKTVLLTTDNQTATTAYVLTASSTIKDIAGNPIISGTSDTALFTGSGAEPVTQEVAHPAADALKVSTVTAQDSTHLQVVFSKPVVLNTDPRENFIITEKQKTENTLDISKVDLSADLTTATLTTAAQNAVKYSLMAIDVKDKDGNKLDLTSNAAEFTGSTTAAGVNAQGADTTAPEDVTNLLVEMLKKLVVTLSWKGSANTLGDLASYVLYMSTDGVAYGKGILVSPDAKTFDVTNILPKVKYWFKLAARDKTGNESQGVVTTFTLPATGPEIGLVLFGSFVAGKIMKRKKRVAKK
ncbi:MAG: fibronectin type III domain-containing protein [Candidatus Gracilibacteria bacterium]|jgi:hypothetical protein